ncbi:spore germination protein [Tumebacillus sp. DT12]|uniref:Spore germination protein n=1 Tax=Tumebacillus lacus TaxID=2995335 RepID=A0ABT3WVV4_9BACL|nr:spore germination protein [Tumebacillus lacus]MCX7568764.1 spore germination protein [Tumebacillus lacus]
MRETSIRKLFDRSPDVVIRPVAFGEGRSAETILLIFCTTLCDIERIDEIVLPRLYRAASAGGGRQLVKTIPQLLSAVPMEFNEEYLVEEVFGGTLILFHEQTGALFTLGMSKRPNRNVEETNTEVSVRGPRDGFIEDLNTNIALIRKRLRTPTLTYEQFVIGRRSKTQVALLYMTDITRDDVIAEVRDRIKQVDVDLLPSIESLGKTVATSSYRFFPAFIFTGRPDFAADALVNGRFLILMDGDPTCMIAPVELLYLLKTAEDNRLASVYVMAERMIRLVGLFFALFMPAFWTALVVYHQDQLPYRMLATVTMARQGVPFPAGFESFIMLFLFELFREAGARMPKAVGQTLSVVGGLIIGDAAIRAGLASPGQVVVIAMSFVATSTLVHHSLTGTASLLRMFFLLVSTLLGMYGVVLSFIGLILCWTNIEYFGVHYLASINYSNFRQLFAATLFLPYHELRKRAKFLRLKDETSGGDEG